MYDYEDFNGTIPEVKRSYVNIVLIKYVVRIALLEGDYIKGTRSVHRTALNIILISINNIIKNA